MRYSEGELAYDHVIFPSDDSFNKTYWSLPIAFDMIALNGLWNYAWFLQTESLSCLYVENWGEVRNL